MTELLLFLSAVLAGALNAVAGGGTFFVFPALIFAGVEPIAANATSTIAVWPGAVASAYAYRREFVHPQKSLRQMLLVSLAGGAAGALVLLGTPSRVFEFMIPWLLLAASLLFTFSPQVNTWLRRRKKAETQHPVPLTGAILLQFSIAFYGGYFGAGIGILMLALLALLGMTEIHRMNALKTVLGAAINGIAVAIFLFSGKVVWGYAALMVIGSILGGYFGAHVAQKLPEIWVRRFVMLVAWGMTLKFFIG